MGAKALRFNSLNSLLKGVRHLHNRLLQLVGVDPKEVVVGVPKVDAVVVLVMVGVVVGCPNSSSVPLLSIKVGGGEDLLSPNSSMVSLLSIKAGAGEGLISKEVGDMVVVALAEESVVWAVART